MTQSKFRLFLRNNKGFLFILPWLIGFLVFKMYPFFNSLYYSFTKYNLMKPPAWLGLDNYIRIFTKDKDFVPSLLVTLRYVILVVPIKLLLALLVAMLLNRTSWVMNFFRTIYYLPSIVGGSVAVAMIWRVLFSETGVVNAFIGAFGIQAQTWLSPSLALFTISLLNIWTFGSTMVLFLAALKGIPKDLYEAAAVDGVPRLTVFFRITLPMISSIIFFNLLMALVNAFQEFNSALLITGGGPLKSTYLYGYMLYDNAFVSYKMGYACAQSWILFAIILVLTIVIFKTSDKWTYYDDGGDF